MFSSALYIVFIGSNDYIALLRSLTASSAASSTQPPTATSQPSNSGSEAAGTGNQLASEPTDARAGSTSDVQDMRQGGGACTERKQMSSWDEVFQVVTSSPAATAWLRAAERSVRQSGAAGLPVQVYGAVKNTVDSVAAAIEVRHGLHTACKFVALGID